MGFSTDAIHAGQKPDPSTNAVIPPIHLTTTYYQEEIGKHKGYVYSRSGNPTRDVLQKNIATLERGKYALAFSSGLAAIHAMSNLLKNGDHAIVSNDVYGGTYRLFKRVLTNFGITFTFVDTTKVENVEKAIQPNTKLVHIETPTNPLLAISDIAEISNLCKSKNLILSVDNTFMSPYFQNPLELGADIVVHSATKYLGGHSDLLGGILILNSDELYEKLKFIQNAIGAVLSPFDSWLLLRSVKTLAVRMERHNQNAMKIAEFLNSHPKVRKVFYPGLQSHPQHLIAKKQMRGFGGMVSFEVDDFETAKNIIYKFQVFTLAESLGGVESLVCHPATMTHASIPKEIREKNGLTDGLIRLSVGIEDIEDLLNDLEQALK
ncbi:MAG: cystathionine gamma-synthase [Ignavibacteria bacterium]|jgi:O-succinylhomoserine (thiol)-lyase|nr:cystathionine gamma-synthase [Ignavibacteria bacterium]MDH7527423.1 cystathionine gamma-synthase [Ignavibacteria bacterium]